MSGTLLLWFHSKSGMQSTSIVLTAKAAID
jgi:hypothetical protein